MKRLRNPMRWQDLPHFPLFTAIAEAFMLALPAVVAMNLLQLLVMGASWLLPEPQEPWAAGMRMAMQLPDLLRQTLPFLFMLALIDVLARRFDVHRVATSLTGLVALLGLAGMHAGLGGLQGEADPGRLPLLLLALPLALLTVGLMVGFTRHPPVPLIGADAPLSPTLLAMLRAVPAAACALPLLLMAGAAMLGGLSLLRFEPATVQAIGGPLTLGLYTLCTQVFWFLGMHGSNLAEDLLRQFTGGLPAGATQALFNGFIHLGGAGATAGLLLAVLLDRHRHAQSHVRSICRLAVPFSVFNINELLIFGLPIAFNPLWLVPFVLAPLVNAGITLAAIEWGLFTIVDPRVPWATPPVLAAWRATGGSFTAVLLQVLCLLVDTLIYLPFVRRSRDARDSLDRLRPMFAGRSAVSYVAAQMMRRGEERYRAEQHHARRMQADTRAALAALQGGRFTMHFQPKVELATGRVVGAEALLRLVAADGQVRSPFFLPALWRLGLSSAMDDKVTELVFEQLEAWEKEGFLPPPISINLDRDFLFDNERIERLITQAHRFPLGVEIEITEHTFMDGGEALNEAVKRLRTHGVMVSLDDFGAGYSSLGRLAMLECDVVKLDRALVQMIETDRGAALVRHVVAICRELGYDVLAEGVETPAQQDLLRGLQVPVVQGYLTGRPMSADELVRFVRRAALSGSGGALGGGEAPAVVEVSARELGPVVSPLPPADTTRA